MGVHDVPTSSDLPLYLLCVVSMMSDENETWLTPFLHCTYILINVPANENYGKLYKHILIKSL